MAFFGLTALGAQNPFGSLAKDHAILNIFSEDEFHAAFDKVSAGSGSVTKSDIPAVFGVVFHGPAPQPDIDLFSTFLPDSNSITWESFSNAYKVSCENILKAEEDENANIGSGAHYNSYDELMSATRKGLRTEDGPKDYLSAPLTAVQEIGWNCHEFIEKKTVHGKKSCPETVYASELVKSGLYL